MHISSVPAYAILHCFTHYQRMACDIVQASDWKNNKNTHAHGTVHRELNDVNKAYNA